MGKLSVRFKGGFAWVFSPVGTATVGLVRTSTATFQHRMELHVEESKVLPGTSHPGRSYQNGGVSHRAYTLREDVSLTCDGCTLPLERLERNVSTTPTPGNRDDFYYVYGIARLSGQTPPPLAVDWESRLVARMKLASGKLRVSEIEPRPCFFVDGDKKSLGARELATQIVYDAKCPVAKVVEISAADGRVALDASTDLDVTVLAECSCGSVILDVGDPLPGFDEVFTVYGTGLGNPFRVIPLYGKIEMAPLGVDGSGGPVNPGPDCPPGEF